LLERNLTFFFEEEEEVVVVVVVVVVVGADRLAEATLHLLHTPYFHLCLPERERGVFKIIRPSSVSLHLLTLCLVHFKRGAN